MKGKRMKTIKQIEVNAEVFQKWVETSIPGLEVDVWQDKWELFVSHPTTPSAEDDVWDIALQSALQSDTVEVRNVAGNGDIVGCRKNGKSFHCFFMGDAERVNSLGKMMKEVEGNFSLAQWKEIAEGINVD